MWRKSTHLMPHTNSCGFILLESFLNVGFGRWDLANTSIHQAGPRSLTNCLWDSPSSSISLELCPFQVHDVPSKHEQICWSCAICAYAVKHGQCVKIYLLGKQEKALWMPSVSELWAVKLNSRECKCNCQVFTRSSPTRLGSECTRDSCQINSSQDEKHRRCHTWAYEAQ